MDTTTLQAGPSTDEVRRHLKSLAESALGAYGLQGRVTLLNHTINTTFRVEAHPRTGPGQGAVPGVTRYVMRLYRPEAYSKAAIRSEMAWLRILRGDAAVEVPPPVATADGEDLAVVGGEAETERYCVLFRWLDGRFATDVLTPAQAAQVGELLGCGFCGAGDGKVAAEGSAFGGERCGGTGAVLEAR